MFTTNFFRVTTCIITPLVFSMFIIGCSNIKEPELKQIETEVSNTEETKVYTSEAVSYSNMEVAPASWSINTKIATDMPVLDFADNNIVIIHDYFGLFIYNLNTDEIEDSIDLQALGYDFSNDSSCKISVSPNADTIWIWTTASELPYEYNRVSKKLSISNDLTKKDIFENFILTKDIPSEELSVKPWRCSKNSILFADGSYGILNVKNEKISGISYIRNNKEWTLFSEKNCIMPELLKQDDVFYSQFVEEGVKSAESLVFAYCTMINYREYAGICALSEGVEYSEKMQKEWNELELFASSQEIGIANDKACFKLIIQSSDSLPDSNLLKGTNEKYIYLKKDMTNGWFVENFWNDSVPDKEWWN